MLGKQLRAVVAQAVKLWGQTPQSCLTYNTVDKFWFGSLTKSIFYGKSSLKSLWSSHTLPCCFLSSLHPGLFLTLAEFGGYYSCLETKLVLSNFFRLFFLIPDVCCFLYHCNSWFCLVKQCFPLCRCKQGLLETVTR